MKQTKAAQAIAYLRELVGVKQELAEQINLKDYETKDGQKISVDDEPGKVSGNVKDGDYELADGSTLTVKDEVASVKEAEAPAATEEEKAADATTDTPAATGDNAPADDDADADNELKQSIDALTAAINQLIQGIGLKEQELAETKTKLAAAEQKVEEADKKPIDKKPGVGQGIVLSEEPTLTKAQRALAIARATAKA